MTYRITFNMTSPIVYMKLPIFDSILAYAKYQNQRKLSDTKSPSGNEIDNIELPLKKHAQYDFYLASYVFSDHIEEGIDSWKKRWASRHDFIADFGEARRRVNTASGDFKSYDIPLVTQSARKIWFYFDGDPVKVGAILQNLNGIGKKTAIGFGWFSDFQIEESQENYALCRPLPFEFLKTNLRELQGLRVTKEFGAWKMPYWKAEYQGDILIPFIS